MSDVRKAMNYKGKYLKYVLVPEKESSCGVCFFHEDLLGCVDNSDFCDQEKVIWKIATEDEYALAKLRGAAS